MPSSDGIASVSGYSSYVLSIFMPGPGTEPALFPCRTSAVLCSAMRLHPPTGCPRFPASRVPFSARCRALLFRGATFTASFCSDASRSKFVRFARVTLRPDHPSAVSFSVHQCVQSQAASERYALHLGPAARALHRSPPVFSSSSFTTSASAPFRLTCPTYPVRARFARARLCLTISPGAKRRGVFGLFGYSLWSP